MEMNQKPLAMAYVPWQTWKEIYTPAKALAQGTIFEELDLEFKGSSIMPRKGDMKNGY